MYYLLKDDYPHRVIGIWENTIDEPDKLIPHSFVCPPPKGQVPKASLTLEEARPVIIYKSEDLNKIIEYSIFEAL